MTGCLFFGRKHLAPIAIMIVDDSKEWRLRLRRWLELTADFCVVAEAADGVEGIEKASQLFPNIVLLDIGMPRLNGIEAAPRIRKVSPQSTIIFLTQEQDNDIRAAAFATGAVAYLLKSGDVSRLRHTIREFSAQRTSGSATCHVVPIDQLHQPVLDIPSRHVVSVPRREP